MKHNLLKSVIISVILLMGVSNAWGYTISSAKIYYDDSNSKWGSNVVVAFDKNDGGAVFAMTKINNTSLHYWTGSWGDDAVSYMRFGKTDKTHNWYAWWNDVKNTWDLSQTDKWTGVSNGWGIDINNAYIMFGAESNSSGANLTKTDLSGYSSLNYNQTVQQHLSTNGSAYAASTASIAIVKVSSYKLSNATTTAADSKNIDSGKSNATCSAARTATVTYTVSGINTGYKFVGWYDGDTQKSTSTTYTYQATEAKTITARFEKTYAVTISAGANGTVSPTGSQQVGYSTKTTIKATASTGYKFKNWTTTGGVVIANANNATTAITATATGTVKANFEEDLTSTWHIVGDPTSIFKGTSTWAAHNDNMLKKTTGASTASKGSLIIDVKTLPANNDSYQFKVLNTNGPKWYGWSNQDYYWMNGTKTTNVYNADDHNLYFIPNALGEYKFDVDWSNTNPSLKVTFPTAYAVTFGTGIGGSSVTAKYSNTSFNSGTKVQSGKTVTFTQSAQVGYTFKEWNTKEDGTGTQLSTDATYTRTVTTSNTVYAVYTKLPSKVIYLEPTSQWNANDPTYVAHVWKGGEYKDITMQSLGGSNQYYKCEVPDGYTDIVFYRKSTDGTTIWNQTGNLKIPTNNNTLYVITNNTTSPATGNWEAATATVQLGKCKFGRFGFEYNDIRYYSKEYSEVEVEIPLEADIDVLEGEPASSKYSGIVFQKEPLSHNELNGTTQTILNDILLEDKFVLKEPTVVYLGVPNDLEDWKESNNSGIQSPTYYVWRYTPFGSLVMNEGDRGELYLETPTFKYYKFNIAAESSHFQFQLKSDMTTEINKTYRQSIRISEYGIPLTDINCFVLDRTKTGGDYNGYWTRLPQEEGDYRILYIEQVVGTDDWKTVIDTTYQHASDIIKKGDGATIVSLHIGYDKTQHPEVILQKFTNGEWVDVEGQAHMVLGPLTADASMAMIAGRRNTEGDANLRYDDGIEKIKVDAANGKEGRVWNFVVQQQQSGTSAYIDFNALELYDGKYYIRTDNAAGGWTAYTISSNEMSYSEYSLLHSGYSHYFCKWVESTGTPDVKFVVANDYGAAISDPIAADEFTNNNSTLKADANVRWMWNEYTNEGSRAYIAGSSQDKFLTATYADYEPQNFNDLGDWVYEIDLDKVQVGDALKAITALYDGKYQQLLEETYRENGLVMLASDGGAGSSYTVRVVYDFKINKTLCYLIPTENAVATYIDVIIERINQDKEGEATQVKAAITPANAKSLTVYGVITLTKDHITDPDNSEQEALTYWISFPFNVRIGDITGFGEVGKHWMIKYYDGAERAEKGWFLDTKTFWKFFTNTDNVMNANTGYVLTLNKNLLNESNSVYDNTDTLKLYFPSMTKITEDITSGFTTPSVTIDPLQCNITSPADRTIKDSHWNLIGVPSYAHKTNNNSSVKFFYDYNFHDDTYSPEKNEGPNTFYAMHAYMVQFAGTINWSTFATAPAQLAAKKNADAEEQYTLRLELQQNGTKADQTFVELHDDATTMFDMNVDLTKMFNASSANIYTLIGSDNQVAANVMPIANTTIPVGVQIAKAGEYTFAMPDGTAGITVELIDYETNTRTNLLFNDYTVNLPAGTNESRFALYMQPSKVATDMENISDETTGLKKYIIDGQLFLQKDGILYDAQGHIVR